MDEALDLELMNRAASLTIGLHDFGSFATPNPGGTTIREVKTAYWRRVPITPLVPDEMASHEAYRTPSLESGLVVFTIVADAFARNMVRSWSAHASKLVRDANHWSGLPAKWPSQYVKAQAGRLRRRA